MRAKKYSAGISESSIFFTLQALAGRRHVASGKSTLFNVLLLEH